VADEQRRPDPSRFIAETYDQARQTAQYLGDRIESVKRAHNTLKKLEAGRQITAQEKSRRVEVIKTDVRWLRTDCINFARNRNVEGQLSENLYGIKRKAKLIRTKGVGKGRARRARDYWIMATTGELSRWLEEYHLLLSVAPFEHDFFEDGWNAMVRESLNNYFREHPRVRKDTDRIDGMLADLEDDDGGDDDRMGGEDGDTGT